MPPPPQPTNSNPRYTHPFANSKNLLVVIPQDSIDVDAESRLYDELCAAQEEDITPSPSPSSPFPTSPRAPSPGPGPASIFSKDIWLGDNSGFSLAFSRDVTISGWTSVGDRQSGGAYVVYDCVIKTKEGTTIHAHKRYSAFAQLHANLRRYLPPHLLPHLPCLPPKAPLSLARPAFLERRRSGLEYWLACVLLHPDVGGSREVRAWVVDS